MTNKQLAIRQLAWWHLIRQAQGLREMDWPKVPFDPTGPEPSRNLVVKEWEKLIEQGKLPPKPPEPMPTPMKEVFRVTEPEELAMGLFWAVANDSGSSRFMDFQCSVSCPVAPAIRPC